MSPRSRYIASSNELLINRTHTLDCLSSWAPFFVDECDRRLRVGGDRFMLRSGGPLGTVYNSVLDKFVPILNALEEVGASKFAITVSIDVREVTEVYIASKISSATATGTATG